MKILILADFIGSFPRCDEVHWNSNCL